MTFQLNQKVQKIRGYKFPGIIIGIATKLNGKVLYLVECTAKDAEGMCHIFSEADLEAVEEKPIDWNL